MINFVKKFGRQIFAFAFAVLVLSLIYQRLTSMYIMAEFQELRPIHSRINVFYKGYKIGRVLYVKPSEDFKTTYMKIALRNNGLKLPNNIVMKLQREKDKWRKTDYIDIIYPDEPSGQYLEPGDLIIGKSTVDVETFLSSQETDSLDTMKENLNGAIEELQDAIGAVNSLFTTLNDMAEENRGSMKATADNLAGASKNLNNVTSKLNSSIKEEGLNRSVTSLEDTIEKIDELTNSVNANMPVVTKGINETGQMVKNMNEIICGVSNTLKKRFGGLRLIFGRTIDENCTSDCIK